MYINGIGIIGRFGRGKELLLNELESNPDFNSLSCSDYVVDNLSLKDKVLGKKLRRADRYTKMSVLSANDCLNDSVSISDEEMDLSRTGIILATAFGPHNTAFSFLDDIIEYGENNVSAIKFSHSVHNAAASYIALLLGITGPTLTVTQFKFPVQHAFILAQSWLESNICDNVLVCCVDEKGGVFNNIAKQKLSIAENGSDLKPSFSINSKCIPSEGCTCFLMQNNIASTTYCDVTKTVFNSLNIINSDFKIIGSDGLPSDETGYLKINSDELHSYSQIYGSLLIGSAFDCAVGALSLKMKKIFTLNNSPTSNINISSIACHKLDCNKNSATILLSSP
ncbi:MAG: hypothetical protein GY756_01270 [bacterium]|nr:hypothetical protein [bacterium]